jgi:hypothetical protein
MNFREVFALSGIWRASMRFKLIQKKSRFDQFLNLRFSIGFLDFSESKIFCKKSRPQPKKVLDI